MHEGCRVPRILVVDDHAANRAAFQTVLEDLGCDIVLAADGPEALRKAAESPFAVVLLDVRMPGMDGLEVAVALRRLERTRRTPIVFTSADERMLVKVADARLPGPVDYVLSPVEPELLRSTISVFLESHLAQSDAERRRMEAEEQVILLKRRIAELEGDHRQATVLAGPPSGSSPREQDVGDFDSERRRLDPDLLQEVARMYVRARV